MQRVLAVLLVAVACTAAFTTVRAQTAARGSGAVPIDRIAVIVNDDVITVYELNKRTEAVIRQLARAGTPAPGRAELSKQILERMIIDKAQLQFAKESGVRVDDQQLDRSIARIAEANNMTVQQFRDTLEKEGVTYPGFREDIRTEIIIQRLREREVENKIVVSEGEIDGYLAEQARVATQDEYNLAHILVRVPEQATADQLETARRRAEQALAQIKSGTDFRQVAVAFSDAPDALQGGTIGWSPEDRLPPLFVPEVQKMKNGDVSPVLRSSNGFHILKLLDRRKASGTPKVQQTHVRHILMRTSETVPEAEAQRKLLDLKQRLDNKAADFGDLARANSNDSSASKGGDLGWVYPGDMVPEFERAMNALKIGEISAPVQTPFGLHLIQVTERREEDVSQDKQRQQARQALRARKSDEAYQEWLRQLRDRTFIEYHNEDR
jgi:peptidyl-prolyl cis-trans isomerase SurA